MAFLQNIGSALQNAGGYIFGESTDTPTYESLKRKREIVDMLAQRATDRDINN